MLNTIIIAFLLIYMIGFITALIYLGISNSVRKTFSKISKDVLAQEASPTVCTAQFIFMFTFPLWCLYKAPIDTYHWAKIKFAK